MTSNQIAYHDSKTRDRAEDESERHNLVMEDLQRQQLKLNQDIADNEKRWRDESNAIQKEYNNKYLELQKAQGDRKLDIEQELAAIQQRKQNLEEMYKTEDLALRRSLAELQEKGLNETNRSNKALESLRADELALQKKKLEYSNTQFLLENQMRMNELDFKRLQLNTNQYQFEKQLQIDWYDLGLRSREGNQKIRESNSNIFRNYLTPFGNLVNNSVGTLPLLFK